MQATLRFLKGSRSFNIDLYEDNAYPYGFITPVQMLWRPTITLPGQKELPKVSDIRHTIFSRALNLFRMLFIVYGF
jgi:hypothetical protein